MKNVIIFVAVIIAILFAIWMVRFIRFESQLKQLYSQQCLIKNGMNLTEVYEILDSEIKPQVHISLNVNDSTYTHRVFFPMQWNSEVQLVIKFNPYTLEVIDYPACDK